jgi:hypothetical protein
MTSHSGAIVGAGPTLPFTEVVAGLLGLFAVPPLPPEEDGDDGEVVVDDFVLSDDTTVVVEPLFRTVVVTAESAPLDSASPIALSD